MDAGIAERGKLVQHGDRGCDWPAGRSDRAHLPARKRRQDALSSLSQFVRLPCRVLHHNHTVAHIIPSLPVRRSRYCALALSPHQRLLLDSLPACRPTRASVAIRQLLIHTTTTLPHRSTTYIRRDTFSCTHSGRHEQRQSRLLVSHSTASCQTPLPGAIFTRPLTYPLAPSSATARSPFCTHHFLSG